MQFQPLTEHERKEIIKLLASLKAEKLHYICKYADKILNKVPKTPFSKTPYNAFKEILPVFQVLTLHHLKGLIEYFPDSKGDLLSIQKVIEVLSSLPTERLFFVISNMDKLLGSNLSFSAQASPLIIERLAFLNDEYYENFKKIIETIGNNLFDPLTSNDGRFELLLEIMQLASMKQAQVRSFIEYIDLNLISRNCDTLLKMIRDWKFMELAIGWE